MPLGNTVFYLSDSTSLGCKSLSNASVSVTINSNPTLLGMPSQSDAQCGNLNGSITNVTATGNGPFTYQWFNNGIPITGANTDSLVNIGSGVYNVIITDTNHCTINSSLLTFTISSTGAVVSSFTPSVIQGDAPLDVTFTNGSTGAVTYEWIFGNGVTSTLSTPTVQTTYTASGTYTVILIASNGTCQEVATQTINVTSEPSIIIPNIFTPNDDGINDLFFIQTVGIVDLTADIYNRWGTLVYTLNGATASWDGTNNHNEKETDGTYYIILKATDVNGKTYNKQGYVTLIR